MDHKIYTVGKMNYSILILQVYMNRIVLNVNAIH